MSEIASVFETTVSHNVTLPYLLTLPRGDVRFTVYSEANHDSWTATYDNPDLYTWFLSHKRGGSGPFTAGSER